MDAFEAKLKKDLVVDGVLLKKSGESIMYTESPTTSLHVWINSGIYEVPNSYIDKRTITKITR